MSRMGIVAGAVVLGLLSTVSPAAAVEAAAEVAWTEEKPNFTWSRSGLLDVLGAGEDIWTAGYQGKATLGDKYLSVDVLRSKPVVQRYSAGRWTSFSLPGLYLGQMSQLAAGGPQNVWVSGESYSAWLDPGSPYLAHWDGTTWTRIPLPQGVDIADLTVASDATFVTDAATRELYVHANGKWTVDTGISQVTDLKSHPTGGAWVQGVKDGKSVTARWISGSWQPIPLPEGASSVKKIYPLAAGYLLAYTDQKRYARWDGASWSPVGPDQAPEVDEAALAPSGALWLTDSYYTHDDVELPVFTLHTTVYRLNGPTWSDVTGTLPSTTVRGVTGTPGRIWVAGERSNGPVVATTTG